MLTTNQLADGINSVIKHPDTPALFPAAIELSTAKTSWSDTHKDSEWNPLPSADEILPRSGPVVVSAESHQY